MNVRNCKDNTISLQIIQLWDLVSYQTSPVEADLSQHSDYCDSVIRCSSGCQILSVNYSKRKVGKVWTMWISPCWHNGRVWSKKLQNINKWGSSPESPSAHYASEYSWREWDIYVYPVQWIINLLIYLWGVSMEFILNNSFIHLLFACYGKIFLYPL